MSRDEAIAQCGAWITLPTQSHDCLDDNIMSLRSTTTEGVSSDTITALSASSGAGQATYNRVAGPESAASTTSVTKDNASTSSKDTQASQTSNNLPTSHESVTTQNMGDEPLSSPAHIYPSNREGLTSRVSSGSTLTAANLGIHERAMPALPSSDSSVASWLASGMDEHPLGAVDWSRLVASDPLAAETEAVTVVGPHGQARKSG